MDELASRKLAAAPILFFYPQEIFMYTFILLVKTGANQPFSDPFQVYFINTLGVRVKR